VITFVGFSGQVEEEDFYAGSVSGLPLSGSSLMPKLQSTLRNQLPLPC